MDDDAFFVSTTGEHQLEKKWEFLVAFVQDLQC